MKRRLYLDVGGYARQIIIPLASSVGLFQLSPCCKAARDGRAAVSHPEVRLHFKSFGVLDCEPGGNYRKSSQKLAPGVAIVNSAIHREINMSNVCLDRVGAHCVIPSVPFIPQYSLYSRGRRGRMGRILTSAWDNANVEDCSRIGRYSTKCPTQITFPVSLGMIRHW